MKVFAHLDQLHAQCLTKHRLEAGAQRPYDARPIVVMNEAMRHVPKEIRDSVPQRDAGLARAQLTPTRCADRGWPLSSFAGR